MQQKLLVYAVTALIIVGIAQCAVTVALLVLFQVDGPNGPNPIERVGQ